MLRLRGGCGGISPDTAKDRNENQEIEHIYVEDSEEEGSVEDLVVEETPEDVEIEHINVVDSAKEESPKLNVCPCIAPKSKVKPVEFFLKSISQVTVNWL